MTGAPSEVALKQLDEVAIKSTVEPKADEKADA
jgi:hypothetical protein